MDELTVRRALRAAAKVAFSFSVAGCGGAIAPEAAIDSGHVDTTGPGADGGHVALSDAASSRDTGVVLASCNEPSLGVDASVGDDTFACCRQRVDQAMSDASWPRLGDAAASDPGVVMCCNAVILHVEEKPADYAKASHEIQPCCQLLHSPIGVACTPWGPPVPPAMPEEIA